MFENKDFFGSNSYELNIGFAADAMYSIDTILSLDTKFNFKDNEKKNLTLIEIFCSIDRDYLNKGFRKKSVYIDICKSELKKEFNIKNRENLINYLDVAMRTGNSEKMNRTLDIYNFFDKTTKKYPTFAEAIIDYYRLSDFDMEIDGDIEELKDYYKKCFKIIFTHKELLNKNEVYALDICRAVQVVKNGYISSYITAETAIDYIESFGREISQKFNSWKDFYKSLLLALVLEDFFESKSTRSTSLLIEKIKNIDIALDKDISIYNYVKFRENPRENISDLLESIYKFNISEHVELNLYKIKDMLTEDILNRDEIKKYDVNTILKENTIIDLKEDEELISVYPKRVFAAKKIKLNKEDVVLLTNKSVILILKSKKETDVKKIDINTIDAESIKIINKNLCYEDNVLLKNILGEKEYKKIVEYYLIDIIKKIKKYNNV